MHSQKTVHAKARQSRLAEIVITEALSAPKHHPSPMQCRTSQMWLNSQLCLSSSQRTARVAFGKGEAVRVLLAHWVRTKSGIDRNYTHLMIQATCSLWCMNLLRLAVRASKASKIHAQSSGTIA